MLNSAPSALCGDDGQVRVRDLIKEISREFIAIRSDTWEYSPIGLRIVRALLESAIEVRAFQGQGYPGGGSVPLGIKATVGRNQWLKAIKMGSMLLTMARCGLGT